MESHAQSTPRRWTRRRVVSAAGLVALIAACVVLALKLDLTGAAESAVRRLRGVGPEVFFAAMALLPAAGFPMIAFTLVAGPVFGPTLGAGWVVAWSMTAVVGNLLLTHWLANRALRPLVSRLLDYFEFRLPVGTVDDAWESTLIVRLAPGVPFWVQSYLLGLIRVPLGPYLVVSTAVMSGYIVALVFGGEAIANGNARLAVASIGILAVFIAALQLARKRTARRRATAAIVLPSVQIMPAK
jgi:uncharacterized membrane protein YdjX (TVP38/TMEM64 family)